MKVVILILTTFLSYGILAETNTATKTEVETGLNGTTLPKILADPKDKEFLYKLLDMGL